MRQGGAFCIVKHATRDRAQPGHDQGSLAGADLLFVFFEGAVFDVMQTVFNAPVIADQFGQTLGREPSRGLGTGDQIIVDFIGARLGLRPPRQALNVDRGDLPRLWPQSDNVGRRRRDPGRARYDIVPPFSTLCV